MDPIIESINPLLFQKCHVIWGWNSKSTSAKQCHVCRCLKQPLCRSSLAMRACVCVWVHACVLACEGRIVCAASNIGHEEGRDWLIDCALFWTMPPRWFLWAKHSHRHCAFLSGISSSLPIAAAAAPSSLSFLLVTCMRPLWLLLLLPLCPTPLPYPSASTLLLFVLDRSRIIPLSASLSIVYSTP